MPDHQILKKKYLLIKNNFANISKYILIFIIFFSSIHSINQISDIKLFYNITKAIIFILLSLLLFIRISIHGLKIFVDEIVISIFCIIAVLSGIINNKNFFIDTSEPILLLVLFLGISSFWKINKSLLNIEIILKIFIFITLTHLILSFLINTFDIITKDSNKYIPTLYNSINWLGFYKNPNHFGFTMQIGILSSVSIFLYNNNENQKIKIEYLFFLLVFFIGLFFSQSRAALLGSIFYILITFVFFHKNWINTKNNINILFIIFFIILFVFILYKLNLINIIIEKFRSQNGASERIKFWVGFITDKFQNFSFKEFFIGKGFSAKINVVNPELSLHNTFFDIWGRYGVINVFLSIFLIFYVLKKNYNNKQTWFIYFIPYSILIFDFFEGVIFITPFWLETLFFVLIFLLPYNLISTKNLKDKKIIYSFYENNN